MRRLDLLWCVLPFLFLGSVSATELPDPHAIAQARIWQQQVLRQGATGLFQAVSQTDLLAKAGLNRSQEALLATLPAILSSTPPERARPYWNKTTGQWLLRLDFPQQRVNFLLLDVNAHQQLVDWQDLALGTSLAGLLKEAGSVAPSRLGDYIKTLGEAPLTALQKVPVHSELARLALAACKDSACHAAVYARLPVRPGEVSLFALEKAVLKRDFEQADFQLQRLTGALGEDPAVTWLIATVALTEGRCEKVLPDVLAAIERWPGEARLYPLASQCQIQSNQPAAALATLKNMERNTAQQINWGALLVDPVYAPLKNLVDP